MHTNTRKLITIYRALHLRLCVDRLHIPRRVGGRGLVGVEDCAAEKQRSVEKY